MQEYLLLNYPQDVRNNLKKLIKMPKEEEPKNPVDKTECAARFKKKKGKLQAVNGREEFVEMLHHR